MLTLEQIGIIVAIVVGVLAGIYYVLRIHKEIRKPPPEFVLQRFKESVEKPVKSNWSIRILHPNKPIEKCMVFYGGIPLPWWDRHEPYYERTIVAGGGGNVRISIEIEKKDAEVKIMDGKKTLKRLKFKDITMSQA